MPATVTVTGTNAIGLQANSGGSITGNNVAVSVSSSDTGDTVYGAFATGTAAAITLTGGSVQVSDGNSSGGLYADNGATITGINLDVSATVATATGTETYAVNANGGTINLTGGHVQGGGAYANVNYGLYVDNGGTINASDVAVAITNGANVTGVQAFAGTITMTGGSVQANGTTFAYGLNSVSGTTITGRNGVTISASADTAYGAYSDGGEIGLTGGSVQANGTSVAYGLYSWDGATVAANNVAVTASSGSGGFVTGAEVIGTNSILQLNGGSVAASGGNADGLYADAGGAITGTDVTVTSSGTGAYVSGGSSLTLTGGSLTASGGNAIFMTGGAVGTPNTITVTAGTLSSPFADLISANTAVSNITLHGVTTGASGTNYLLSIWNSSTVNLTADQGSRLTGDIVADATSTADIKLLNESVLTGAINGAGINVLIDPSVWNVTGDSSVATLDNQGAVVFAPPSGGAFKTVTVSGLYSSSGGSITFNTFLNDGGTQQTDKLVAGSTAGTTTVFVHNAGGPGGVTGTGPTSGIQLVNVTGGAAASSGNFVLGQRVAGGLFDYNLVKADGQNWYLQSDAPVDAGGNPIVTPGTVSPEIPNIASLNTLGLLTGQAQLDTLQFRLGEFHRLDAGTSKASELWGRGYYHEDNLHTGDFGAAQVDIGGTQVGGDLHFHDLFSRGDHVYLGGFAEYANAEGRPYVGKTTLDSYGAGLYATYYKEGWYADAIFKGDYNDYHAQVPGDPEMSTSGYGLAGSLEGGYQFSLGHGWAVEPQAQLAYQYQEIDSMNDPFGRTYDFNNPQTLDGRLGVKVEKSFLFHDGRRITPYLRTSVTQDMLGNNRLTVASVTVDTPYGGTSAMFDGGITANLTRDIDLYASGILVAGTKQDSTGVSGGVRFAW